MRSIASKTVACLLAMLAAFAATTARATDYGDIWWNPSEPGWGLQIAHQGNVLFLTFYVFRNDRTPVWFTAAAFQTTPGGTTYSGDMIATTGPYYGGAFTPPAVNRVAGTVTFNATSVTAGTLTYTVDGVTVNKNIQRYAFNLFDLSGIYIGSFLALQHSCANPISNGPFTGSGQFTITHNSSTQQVTIVANLSDNLRQFTCTYTGTYGQDGRLGRIGNGSYICTDGNAGAFSATEIEVASQGGILGRYAGTNVALGCQLTGGFGGLKP